MILLKSVFIIAIAFVLLIPTTVFAQPTDRCSNLNPGALLMNCDLHEMDLSKKNLGGADLGGADLGGADLRGADLRYVSLRGADLGGADLRYADLRGADLGGADLRWATLTGADLRYADLGGADLRWADLRWATLSDVILRGADLGGADLGGANIHSTNFAGVNTSNIIGLENAAYNENSIENNKKDYTKNSDELQTNSLAKIKCGIGTMLKNGQCIVDTNYKTPEPTSEGGGCLIATATYGSEMSQQVQQLRELRDSQLLQTESGTVFMGTFNDVYYSFSPVIADYERENPLFKEAVKIAIIPMISSLSLMENAETESEVLGIGISVIMFNLGMYLGVPAIVVVGIRKKF